MSKKICVLARQEQQIDEPSSFSWVFLKHPSNFVLIMLENINLDAESSRGLMAAVKSSKTFLHKSYSWMGLLFLSFSVSCANEPLQQPLCFKSPIGVSREL
jgi:hypothetical protein